MTYRTLETMRDSVSKDKSELMVFKNDLGKNLLGNKVKGTQNELSHIKLDEKVLEVLEEL